MLWVGDQPGDRPAARQVRPADALPVRGGEPVIKVGLPKGRMIAQSEAICAALGAEIKPGVLRYRANLDGCPVGIYLLKAPDIGRMVENSVLDLGLTGDEWLLENGVPGERWCAETGSYVASVCLLMAARDRRSLRWIRSVVTPYPGLARALLGDVVPGCQVMAVAGSSEGLVPDVGDACLDLVETGNSAACNGLVIRRTFRRVTTHVARSGRAPSWCWRRWRAGQGEDCADFGHAVLAAPYGRLGTLAGVSGECADWPMRAGVVSQQDAAFPSGDHRHAWVENAAAVPQAPAGWPSAVTPQACAQSSISAMPRPDSSAAIRAMPGAALPRRWARTTAVVAGVISGSICSQPECQGSG